MVATLWYGRVTVAVKFVDVIEFLIQNSFYLRE